MALEDEPRTERSPGRRRALAVLVLSTVALAGAMGSAFLPTGAPGWALPLFAVAVSVHLVALMAVGASGPEELRRLRLPLGVLGLLLAGGFLLVLALPPVEAMDPADPVLWLGLPPRAAVAVFGIGLVPVLLVPFLYAWSFDGEPGTRGGGEPGARGGEPGGGEPAAAGDADPSPP